MGGFIAPIQIAATGGSQPCDFTPTPGMVAGPFTFNGALYIALIPFNTLSTVTTDVWKSTDNGITWAALDHANAPTSTSCMQSVFNPVLSCISVVCFDIHGTVLTEIDFDLTTEKWGAG